MSGFLLLTVSPLVGALCAWHYRQYRKGGAYDPTRPEALVAAYAAAARESAGKAARR